MTAGALHLESAPGWLVVRGRCFVLAASRSDAGTGPRTLVADLPEGALLVTDGGPSLPDGTVLLGVPSTSADVRPLDRDAIRTHLAGPDAAAAADGTVRALWAGTTTESLAAGVAPLEPGVVAIPDGMVAESAEEVLWVARRTGDPVLPDDRALGDDGALLAPRVRIVPSGPEPTSVDVARLDDALGREAVAAALGRLLGWAVERALQRAVLDEARVAAAERSRAAHDALVEERGVAHLAAVVTGPRKTPSPPSVSDPVLACAAMIGAHEGFPLGAAPEAMADLEGTDAVRAVARASGVRWRQVHLGPTWWREAEDSMLGYRPDGTPVALLPVGGTYRAIEADGRSAEVDPRVAGELLDVAFVFSAPLADAVDGADLTRFAFRGAARDLVVFALFGLVAGIVGLALPLATGVVFDEIIPQGETGRLAWLVVVLIATAAAMGLLQYAQVARETRIEARAARRLGDAAWDRVLSLPTAVASRFGVGDLAGRVVALDTARDILAQAGLASMATVLASLLVIGVLFVYDVTLAVIALAAGLVALVVTLLLARSVARRSEAFQEHTSAVNGFLLEVLRGLPKLRVAGGEARAFDAWAARFAPAMGIELARASARLQLVLALLVPLGTLVLFGSVAALGGAAAIGVGTFLAFQATYSLYLSTVGQLASSVGTIGQARPLARRLAVVLEERPEAGRGRTDPGRLRGAVELRDVVFRYQPDTPPVLDGLDLRAGPGEFLAIVGPSGCGKSTVMRLLLGFEAAESGSVLYDDRDVAALDIAAVRRQLGVVLQDTQLTPGSVRTNIGAGINLTDDEAWHFAELAALADDLRAMPMGLETMITAGAGAFSGGQRQRLLLARALARRPAVLLLDEATSALDNVAQGVVARNIAHLGITRIVVAHRLSTIASADRIAVLEAGRVAEQGTHDALMGRGGRYADLVARQVV